MPENSDFRIIGKVISADLNAEGNLHITLKNSNQFWAETATRRLHQLKGKVIKTEINEWKLNQSTERAAN
ncbi:MAG: hypothetical protein GX799_05340 [Crenarchaeota archaeon]|jgi:hypothetical protein|nr:hypothetical protein [Thermoproteota archaeon]